MESEIFACLMVKKYGECVAVCESTANLWLKTYQAFEKYNIHVKLANPLKTKAIAEARIKTDKLDVPSHLLIYLIRFVAECYITPREKVKSECICDRIAGYDASTGYPIVDLTEDEEAYLCSESVSEIQSRETAESTPEGNDMLLHDIDFLVRIRRLKMGEIAWYDLSLMHDMSLHNIVRSVNLKETMN